MEGGGGRDGIWKWEEIGWRRWKEEEVEEAYGNGKK
jgi:hypothetical protein